MNNRILFSYYRKLIYKTLSKLNEKTFSLCSDCEMGRLAN